MQDSITKALLFVIALSTSIIAVELIPVNMVNRGRLLCAEYNSEYINEDKEKVLNELKSFIGKYKSVNEYCKSL